MRGRRKPWKRADCRIRLFCRRLTERQRICLLALLFLSFLMDCIHAIGSSLHRFGSEGDNRLEMEHIRPPELKKKKGNEHSTQFYENGHWKNH